jgi:sulfatase maturation enzyme AslB (radical SAM superfamily)
MIFGKGVSTMQNIPKTFCPAKWDELHVNFEAHFSYACCKASPSTFTTNTMEFIAKEQINMMSGVQDPSCEYCWSVERHGGDSLRSRYLASFDAASFDQYVAGNVTPGLIQVNIGNDCNFQCMYCNPKFSSRWEHDVLKKPYKLFTDRHIYQIGVKHPEPVESSIEFLKTFDKIKTLSIMGGEPLTNKKFYRILNEVKADKLQLSTNLSASIRGLDHFLERCSEYEQVLMGVSIDATGRIAEFARHGLDFDQFDRNLEYLLTNKPENLIITVNSLLTSLTVRDLANFYEYMLPKLDNVLWLLHHCTHPKIHSFSTLEDQYRVDLIKQMDAMTHPHIHGIDAMQTLLGTIKFNKTLYQELKQFLNEYSDRNGIKNPICLN